ncbi:MAG: hypothetical protein IJJ01_03225 [Firmicutes bacterium]|nr:hypothetical protein [Bacillota bacterium]
MTDIAPELLEVIEKSFEAKVKGLEKNIAKGVKNYEEAYYYAIKVGEALAKSFMVNITSEVLPDGMMYYNIANRVVLPMLRAGYEISSAAAVQAQKSANKAAGIGIKPQEAEFDEEKAKGIIDRVSSEPFEDVSWILDEPVKTFSKNAVDDTLQKNVEFQGKSGLSPKIVRTASADACEWCQEVAGTYEYPNVPDDVYRRHANCNCIVEYVDGGKIQNVHTKAIYTEAEREAEVQRRINVANKGGLQYAGIPKTWIKNLEDAGEDEILKGTNPEYNMVTNATTGKEERGYNENCANSVVAYEMRCRGYDVTAQPASVCEKLKTEPFSAWEGGEKNKEQSSDLFNVLQYIKNQPEGARIEIAGAYNKNIWYRQRKGHVFVAEKKYNEIVFKDPQSGAIIKSLEEINDFDYFDFLRIDDLEITDRGVSACKKE